MAKYLTKKAIDGAIKHFEDYRPEPDRNIWLSMEDLEAEEIIGLHVTEFIDMDWRALKAQGWEWAIQPNGMVKLRKCSIYGYDID